jgi:hypothetical protein
MDNFAEKAPMRITYITSPTKVEILNEETEKIFSFEWDFSIPIKTFIFGIKQTLIKAGWYPIISKVEKVEVPLTKDEKVKLAMDGIPLSTIPLNKLNRIEHQYLVDKVISYKDIFIIEDLQTQQKYRYHMKRSCIFFLTDMRKGRLDTYTGADFFFKNSELLNEVILKEDQDEKGQ